MLARRSPPTGAKATRISTQAIHRTILAGTLGFLALTGPARAQDTAPSIWVNPEQGWVVEARLCGTELCSHLVAFRMVHPHPPGYIPLDDNNVNPKLRGRPLCGVQLMGGFDPAKRKDNKLDGGWVYDPQTGKTYSAMLTLIDPNHVKLRGYVGIPLFGKNVNLHREADAGPRCVAPPAN
jgi:uncharacterized protein (DUF2147 family)